MLTRAIETSAGRRTLPRPVPFVIAAVIVASGLLSMHGHDAHAVDHWIPARLLDAPPHHAAQAAARSHPTSSPNGGAAMIGMCIAILAAAAFVHGRRTTTLVTPPSGAFVADVRSPDGPFP